MGILGSILGGTIGKIIGEVKGVVDEFHTSGEEKAEFNLRLEAILTERLTEAETTLRTEINAKSAIMVAEMQQEDKFTKRARPSIIYSGLILVFLDMGSRVISFFANADVPLPSSFIDPSFMYTWGAVAGVYAIGRSAEKRGVNNKAVSAITGSKRPALDL